jgi:MFS family permease
MTDNKRIIASQGLRAFAYGFTAVLLGHLLAHRGTSTLMVGILLSSVIAGAAISSLVLMRFGDRFGRRKSYRTMYFVLSVSGIIIAIHPVTWTLLLIAFTGVLSTDANDNGPATTLEQSMLAQISKPSRLAKLFGKYNGVAAICGSLGALSQGALSHFKIFNTTFIGFLVFVPIGIMGALLANGLSTEVESRHSDRRKGLKGSPIRRKVIQLATLFSIDAAAGGLTTSAWLSFYLTQRYHASPEELGILFFIVAALQAASMFLAPYLAQVIGLVPTMIVRHILSSVFLVLAAFCGKFSLAIIFLLLRASLSQMDIPTRQALVMAVVPEPDRTAAAAITNASRYTIRPLSPTIAAATSSISIASPLVLSGVMKVAYDLALLVWAKRGNYLSRDLSS